MPRINTLSRSLRALALTTTLLSFAAAANDDFPDMPTTQLIEDYGLSLADKPLRQQAGWEKPGLILVAEAGANRLAWLQAAVPSVDLRAAEEFDLAARADQVDASIGLCSEDVLRIESLRWVQIYTAGAEKCLAEPGFKARKPLLTNMQRISAPVIAEHAMALVMALSRQLPAFMAQQQDENWSRSTQAVGRMKVLKGQTLLVVGLGGIGTETARRAHALGMRVTAIRNSSRNGPDFVSEVGLSEDLPRLLGEAQVVVNALPLTDDTRGMFDAGLFTQMQDDALFVNVGRGGTVVTADLRDALTSGKLAGAGLDVTDPEPLPKGHPFWRAPNLIITPHVSWSSQLDREARWQVVRENLKRYVAGDRMLSVVDPAEGY